MPNYTLGTCLLPFPQSLDNICLLKNPRNRSDGQRRWQEDVSRSWEIGTWGRSLPRTKSRAAGPLKGAHTAKLQRSGLKDKSLTEHEQSDLSDGRTDEKNPQASTSCNLHNPTGTENLNEGLHLHLRRLNWQWPLRERMLRLEISS